MNAVGRNDSRALATEEDPLAQLKAEAQEAKEIRQRQKAQRMSQEEIAALERGDSSAKRNSVAVTSVDDVDELEQAANRKIFEQEGELKEEAAASNNENAKKKKPWWRFGF